MHCGSVLTCDYPLECSLQARVFGRGHGGVRRRERPGMEAARKFPRRHPDVFFEKSPKTEKFWRLRDPVFETGTGEVLFIFWPDSILCLNAHLPVPYYKDGGFEALPCQQVTYILYLAVDRKTFSLFKKAGPLGIKMNWTQNILMQLCHVYCWKASSILATMVSLWLDSKSSDWGRLKWHLVEVVKLFLIFGTFWQDFATFLYKIGSVDRFPT